MMVTSKTSSQEVDKLTATNSAIMPCWALDKTFQFFSFVEFDASLEFITGFGVYDNKSESIIGMVIIEHFDVFQMKSAYVFRKKTGLVRW